MEKMKKLRTGVCVLFIMITVGAMCLSPFEADAQGEKIEKLLVRIQNPDPQTAKHFITKGYDIASYVPGHNLDMVITKPEFDRLKSLGYNITVYRTEDDIRGNLGKPVRDAIPGYRNYETMLDELQALETAHPDIVKLYDIGDTWGKNYLAAGNTNYALLDHEIWAVKLSDNVAQDEDEAKVYYIGEHHAREPISMEMCMKILNHLVDSYGTDATLTERVDNTEIWFIPLLNPNGHKVVIEQMDIWWRKNVRDNNEDGQFNVVSAEYGSGPDGVDINRNYGFEWLGTGSTDDPNGATYRGPAAFSEPETQAVKYLLDSHTFQTGISYHTYGEWVLYPYGYESGTYAPDFAAMNSLAEKMAESIPGTIRSHGHYEPGPGWELYSTNGDLNDYSYGEKGTFSYTVEMATEFIPPADQTDAIMNNNMEAALMLLARPFHSVLTGHVTDAATGEPVQAEIWVSGIDENTIQPDDRYPMTGAYRAPYRAESIFGRYFRMLTPGTYDVTFKAPGYQEKTFTGLSITETGQTIRDAALARNGTPANNVSCDAIQSAGIAGGSMFIPLSGENVDSWEITVNGQNTTLNGYKTMYQYTGLQEGENTITITAKGSDADGNPVSEPAACIVSAVAPGGCPQINSAQLETTDIRIGQYLTAVLDGTNVDTWKFQNAYGALTYPGSQTQFTLQILSTFTDLNVLATGFDENGNSCEDTLPVFLTFADPGFSNTTMTPEPPVATGEEIVFTVETTNAVKATIHDGLNVLDAEMTPANSVSTSYANTFTCTYRAFRDATVMVTIENPTGQTATHTFTVDVSTQDRVVSGKVTDGQTGWPLFAKLAVGNYTAFSDPGTGAYQITLPDADQEIAVTPGPGYNAATATASKGGDITLDIPLSADMENCYAPGYTKALLFETFETLSIPPGWTVIPQDAPGWKVSWTGDLLSNCYPNKTGGRTTYAISDSDYAGEVMIDTQLITPALDCSGLNAVTLEFKWAFATYSGTDFADVDISTDGGSTWTNIVSLKGVNIKMIEPRISVIDISQYAAGQPDVYIRFHHYDAFYEYGWQLDDVMVYDPNTAHCEAPQEGGIISGMVGHDTRSLYSTVSTDEGETLFLEATGTSASSSYNGHMYALFASPGEHTVTSIAPLCGYEQETVTVADRDAVRLDFPVYATPGLASLIQGIKILAGSSDYIPCSWYDAKGDGKIGPEDAVLLLQYLAELREMP